MIYTYRSRLNQLPVDLKYDLAELTFQKGMLPPSRKSKAVELLRKKNIDFVEIGTGTNRFIIKYDNFATSPEDQIGGKLDIDGYLDRPGRKTQMARSIYNYQEEYGANLVDTTANVNEGQYFVGQQIGQKTV